MIYIHFPFCRSFCTYCGFYSEAAPKCGSRDAEFRRWAAEVRLEADTRRKELEDSAGINTLYIGGGTPSLLSSDCLAEVVESLPGGLGHRYDEFTLECNPDDITPGFCAGAAGLGVNRISMGIQSFDDGILRWMNRRHNAEEALSAFSTLREAGFGNISIDLIFGIADMDDACLERSVKKAIELHPEHISAYQLSIEEGSVLADRVARGEYEEASEEQCRRQYSMLCNMLGEAGYEHYEVSNFALPGHESRHNSAYWERVPYTGLGPGAHSFDGMRTRSWNSTVPSGWTSEKEILSEEDIKVESIMLGLRTAKGTDYALLRENCDRDTVDRLLEAGALMLIKKDSGTRCRIPENHFFVSDEIIRELI